MEFDDGHTPKSLAIVHKEVEGLVCCHPARQLKHPLREEKIRANFNRRPKVWRGCWIQIPYLVIFREL
jgi:hypothetical protein